MQWWINCGFFLFLLPQKVSQCYNHVIFKTADPKIEGEMQSHLLRHREDGFLAFLHWNFNIILHMLHRQQSSLKKQEKKILNFLQGEIHFIVTTNHLHLLSTRTRWLKRLLQVRMPRETKKSMFSLICKRLLLGNPYSLKLIMSSTQWSAVSSASVSCDTFLLPKSMVKISPVPQYMRRM